MIEAYALLAIFTMQILAMSVMGPRWLIKYVRSKATEFPAERFAQLHPGVDHNKTLERYLKLYRALNSGLAVLGLVVLAWLFSYTRRSDWDDGPVEAVISAYFMMQALPFLLFAWAGVRYTKLLNHLLEGKRTAVLQRRGLFDFVSPFTVFIAVLGYFLFVAYVLYIAQNPFPGFAGPLINISMITLVYALEAFAVYKVLYGRRVNRFETHAARVFTIGQGVRACVYISIACVANLSLNFTLVLLDLQRWEPVAQSAFLVLTALLCCMAFTAPPRRPETADLGSEEPTC